MLRQIGDEALRFNAEGIPLVHNPLPAIESLATTDLIIVDDYQLMDKKTAV